MSWKPHGATEEVTYDQLKTVRTPLATRTHYPIPHHKLFDRVVDALQTMNFNVKEVRFLISGKDEGQRFAGEIKIHGMSNASEEYKLAIFNSHDKSIAAAIAEGTETKVCANGCYMGEFTLARKHTLNVWDAVKGEIRDFVFNLKDRSNIILDSMNNLRELDFSSNSEVHDFMIQAMKKDYINPTEIKHILNHWEEPEHHEFKDRNGYSLFNAHTSHWRSMNPFSLPKKSINLRNFIYEFKTSTNESSPISGDRPSETSELSRPISDFAF